MNIRLFQTNCIIINTCKLYFNVYVTNLYTYKRKQLRNGNIGLFSVNKYLDTHIPFKSLGSARFVFERNCYFYIIIYLLFSHQACIQILIVKVTEKTFTLK